MMEAPEIGKLVMIVLTADMISDDDFKRVLEDAIGDYLGGLHLFIQMMQWSLRRRVQLS
jgi:hypothetical protein